MIRTWIAAALLAFGLSGPAAGQSTLNDPAVAAAAHRLVVATDVAGQAEQMMAQQIAYIMGSVQQANPDTPGRVFDILEEEFDAIGPRAVDEIVAHTSMLYAERFTIEEMQAIATFFETDIGQKARRELAALSNDGAGKGREIGQRLGREAANNAMARIRSEGLTLGPAR